jgi:hypothetical protein
MRPRHGLRRGWRGPCVTYLGAGGARSGGEGARDECTEAVLVVVVA